LVLGLGREREEGIGGGWEWIGAMEERMLVGRVKSERVRKYGRYRGYRGIHVE
jgi:hypothetical protein